MDEVAEVSEIDEREVAVAVAKKKRKKAQSCNDLSVKYLTRLGYLCHIVEKRIPGTFITKDMYGFIDILAVRPGEILGVQSTSWDHVSHRVNKIAEHENVGRVRESGMRIVVHGWKRTKQGPKLRETDCS
jgi:hypothetical protein